MHMTAEDANPYWTWRRQGAAAKRSEHGDGPCTTDLPPGFKQQYRWVSLSRSIWFASRCYKFTFDQRRPTDEITGVIESCPRISHATNDVRDYRGARVKRKMVTAVECISADGRYLKPMIIWPASTHRANWTTFPTPGWHYAFSNSGYTDSILQYLYPSVACNRPTPQPQPREAAQAGRLCT
jgi:hypothetical protein